MTILFKDVDLSPAVEALIEAAAHAERAGQRAIARNRYETALYLLDGGQSRAASGIVRRIARSYLDEGQVEIGLDCLEAALAIAEANGQDGDVAHAMNLMANVQVHRGEPDNAEATYAHALELAKRSDDTQLQAMIAQNRGIIASMRGDTVAAIDHYATSLVIYRRTGLHQYIGHTLNNMGLTYVQMGRLDEAQAAYDEAIAHCQRSGDVPHRLLALVNSIPLWLARDEVERAEAVCRTVLVEATEAGDQRALGEAYKHLGVIARARHDFGPAEQQLSAAYDNAIQRQDLLLAAETVAEKAELYEVMGKNREMLHALTSSHRLFTKLRAERSLADLQRRVTRLETRFYVIVKRWAQTIESKDAYTRGHCERVADYACALARDVGFDEITMFWFRVGAVLHDVGKIVVPSEILNKPGRFTPEEREIMERHAAAGSELLRDIEFPWDILPMVRGHHERWDGTGYPDKLAGEGIALSARVTCVADVFDALTTDRPYRPGFSCDEALAMMRADSGRIFDPELFARFEHVIRNSVGLYVPPRRPAIAIAV